MPRNYKGDAGVVNSDIENFRRSVWLVQVVLFFRIYQEKNFKIQLYTQYYPIAKKDGVDYANLCVDHSAMLFPDKMMQEWVYRKVIFGEYIKMNLHSYLNRPYINFSENKYYHI